MRYVYNLKSGEECYFSSCCEKGQRVRWDGETQYIYIDENGLKVVEDGTPCSMLRYVLKNIDTGEEILAHPEWWIEDKDW